MADTPNPAPLHERYLARLKQQRWVAVLLVVAAIVTGVASFTDAARKLVALVRPAAVEDPRQRLLKLDQPFTSEAFIAAAARGDEAAVQLYLQAGMPVDELSPRGTTALIAATQARRTAVVTRLLAAKADPSRRGPGQSPALTIAAMAGDVALTRQLLDAHPAPDVLKHALVSAAADGQLETLRLLLPALGAQRGQVVTDALWALAGGSPTAGIRSEAKRAMALHLLDEGADAQAIEPGDEHFSVLHRAAYSGQIEVAQVLLERGAPADPRDASSATPLWWVAGIGNLDMARLLLAHHADATAASKDGTTVMARARFNRDDAMVAVLRAAGGTVGTVLAIALSP